MRSWPYLVLLGALIGASAGAQGQHDQSMAALAVSTPALGPDSVRPGPPQSPTSVAKSTWFNVDERPAAGWYAPEARDQPLPRWIIHDSLPGDTIENVAIRYDVLPRKLRRWNGLSPTGRLHPSRPKRLEVKAQRLPPARERIVHVAAEGDSWDSIATRYGVFDGHLRAWNKDELGWRLEPGEQVSVWIEPMVRDTMGVDGPVAGRAALIPPGANSIGAPQEGRLAAGVQVPAGPGYELRYPNSSWGTTYAVRHLVQTLDDFHRTSGYQGTLLLGSMSFRRGGNIGPHVSHQSGRDVDIRLPMRPGLPRRLAATGRNVDWDATWALVLAFVKSGAVQTIFLDYRVQRSLVRRAHKAGISEALLTQMFQVPEGIGARQGVVRHSPGHQGHIHVRFACGPYEPACGD